MVWPLWETGSSLINQTELPYSQQVHYCMHVHMPPKNRNLALEQALIHECLQQPCCKEAETQMSINRYVENLSNGA